MALGHLVFVVQIQVSDVVLPAHRADSHVGAQHLDLPFAQGGWGADPENVEALRWRSPIHMPRLASRLTLTVTDVRVEPLQDISEADVLAEGLAPIVTDGRHSLVTMFVDLWNSINGHRAPWNSNPDVVALTFTVEERNIDG